jgi:transposase
LGPPGGRRRRRREISDANWSRIEHLLPGGPGGHGGVARDNRGFVNAARYVAKTGIPWRDSPDRFGEWDTASHRSNAWCQKGVGRRVFEAVRDPDRE